MVTRYDNITIKAELSKDGWIVDRPIITRAGIFTYSNGNKIVKEYRPDAEVFNETSLASLRAIPITDGHKGILNTNSNLDGIVVGSVISNGVKEDSNVVADIVIHNVKKIGSKRELSLGYQCEIDETPGTFNGERYDQIQKSITYNHLAVVNKGRAGNARIRLDSDELASFALENETMDPVLGKVRHDGTGIDYPAAPEIVSMVNDLKKQIEQLTSRADKADAERDTAKAEVVTLTTKHQAELETAKNSARSRVELEAKAKQLDLKLDGSDRDLKIAIAEKLGTKLEWKDRSDEYVNSAYDMTVARDNHNNQKTAEQKKIVTNKEDDNTSNGSVSSADARARMIARIRGEKKDAA